MDEAKLQLKNYNIRSNYSDLWLLTKILSKLNPVQWNSNFRKLGIDGFVDFDTNTIHPSEPTQGVVFTANALKLLQTIDNKKIPTTDYKPDKMSDDQIVNLFKLIFNIFKICCVCFVEII